MPSVLKINPIQLTCAQSPFPITGRKTVDGIHLQASSSLKMQASVMSRFTDNF
jgi:hypothetical protein